MNSAIKNNNIKEFPDGMVPLGTTVFQFDCHPGVSCFTHCCRKLELFLYPYDILRLKKRLGIDSESFLTRYVIVTRAANPFFPALQLKMLDNEARTCPFLGTDGCTVYADRPAACRTYPLERAVARTFTRGRPDEYYFMTRHPYCQGHAEKRDWTVKQWLKDQQIQYYNLMNDLWAEMDTLFAGNPWQGEGDAGPRQQMAFMVCYNLDRFRQYVNEHALLQQFDLDKNSRRLIERDDEALLRFGFDWLKFVLAGVPTLKARVSGLR